MDVNWSSESSHACYQLFSLFYIFKVLVYGFVFPFLFYSVKEKESIPPDDDEDDDEPKKRHLNVVFIGHVGKDIVLKVPITVTDEISSWISSTLKS